jgi:exoribonuclease II
MTLLRETALDSATLWNCEIGFSLSQSHTWDSTSKEYDFIIYHKEVKMIIKKKSENDYGNYMCSKLKYFSGSKSQVDK